MGPKTKNTAFRTYRRVSDRRHVQIQRRMAAERIQAAARRRIAVRNSLFYKLKKAKMIQRNIRRKLAQNRANRIRYARDYLRPEIPYPIQRNIKRYL